ncbi:MAG: hypothetical protein J2P17_34960, partial [Mycobacterium sp.]|nr:hypothetical protein [Mycobacterium sp.]
LKVTNAVGVSKVYEPGANGIVQLALPAQSPIYVEELVHKDTTPPSVPTVTLSIASITTAQSVTVTGKTEGGAKVTVMVNGVAKTIVTANASGSYTASLSGLTAGTHSVAAKAADTAGNTSAASAAKILTVTPVAELPPPPPLKDTTAPFAPTVRAPTSVQDSKTFTVNGTAEAGSTVKAAFNGTTKTTKASATGAYSFTFTAPATAGARTVAVTSIDAAGNVSRATTKTVSVTKPPIPLDPKGDADRDGIPNGVDPQPTVKNNPNVIGAGAPVHFVGHLRNGKVRAAGATIAVKRDGAAKPGKGLYVFKFQVRTGKRGAKGAPLRSGTVYLNNKATGKRIATLRINAQGYVTWKYNPPRTVKFGTVIPVQMYYQQQTGNAGFYSVKTWPVKVVR